MGRGDGYMKCRTLARRTFDRDTSSVCKHHAFYDGQPESGSSPIARAILVDAIEPLKNMRLISHWDARSVVGKADANILSFPTGGDANNEIFHLAVAQGISQQVGENLFDPASVSLHLSRIIRPIDFDGGSAFRNIRFQVVEHMSEQLA